MKLFYYAFSQHHPRTFEKTGVTVGVIEAKDLSEAEATVQKRLSANCALKFVEELNTAEGWEFSIYRSSF